MFGRWGLASKVSSYSLKVCCLFVKVPISSITIILSTSATFNVLMLLALPHFSHLYALLFALNLL